MGTPLGGYLSLPNMPKGMWVVWISISRLRKSSRSISVKFMSWRGIRGLAGRRMSASFAE